jgi:hypothetical protein
MRATPGAPLPPELSALLEGREGEGGLAEEEGEDGVEEAAAGGTASGSGGTALTIRSSGGSSGRRAGGVGSPAVPSRFKPAASAAAPASPQSDSPARPGSGAPSPDVPAVLRRALATAVRESARWRRSRAADVWSLGCVLYHVLDAGGHPYGESWEREGNILRGRADLSRLAHVPEAAHLLGLMLQPDPARRPPASACLEHPLFWGEEARMAFLQDVSDRVEQEPEGGPLRAALEARAAAVFGSAAAATAAAAASAAGASMPSPAPAAAPLPSGGWSRRLPPALLSDGGRYRGYDYASLVDCLRLLRNKRNHYHALPPQVRADIIGSDAPAALAAYFGAPSRFPRLLLAVYEVALSLLAHEPQIAAYLGPLTAAKHAPASRAAAAAAAAPPAGAVASTCGPRAAPASAASAAAAAAPPGTPAGTPAAAALLAAAENAAMSSSGGVDTAVGPCRDWYLPLPEWEAAAAAASLRAASGGGGRVLAATVERGPVHDPSKLLGGGVFGPAAVDAAAAAAATAASGRVAVVAAHASLRETDFRGGAHAFHSRYKSIPCKDFEGSAGRGCPRGVRCDFAHGPLELRVRPAPARRTLHARPLKLALPARTTQTLLASGHAPGGAGGSAAEAPPAHAAAAGPGDEGQGEAPSSSLPECTVEELTMLFPLSVSGLPPVGGPAASNPAAASTSAAAAATGLPSAAAASASVPATASAANSAWGAAASPARGGGR